MKKYISILNVTACAAVVLIHTDEAFWTFSYAPYWLFANFLHCLLLFCVPVFFMISGCNLVNYRNKYSTKEFAKKRFTKTFIPFIGWSFISLIATAIIKTDNSYELSVSSVISGIFNCKYINIYWFFIALFSVYLCIPVISLIPENKRQKAFLYMLSMWLLFNILLPGITKYTFIEWNSNMKFPMVTDYMFYIIAGYYIDNYTIKRHYRYIIYILGTAGLAANIILTYSYSYKSAAVSAPVGDYLSVTTLIYSIAIFTAFKYMPEKATSLLYKLCTPVNNLTFGIYLSHIYFWILIKHSGFFNIFNPVVIIAGAIVTFIAAIILTVIMKRYLILKFLYHNYYWNIIICKLYYSCVTFYQHIDIAKNYFTICLHFIHSLHICNSQTPNIIYLSNGTKTFDKCLNFFIPSPLRNASPGVSFLL